MRVLKVLIACKRSGIVRDAFASLGFVDAWSCDLETTERNGNHIQSDVFSVINATSFDLMIAFPPCTHLCVSGARYFAAKRADGRQQAAVDFFLRLANANIPRICIENPIGIMSSEYRKPDQIIQPYQFGHDASKATCLWLKGLPKLQPTQYVEPRIVDGKKRWANQCDSGQNKLGPSPERAMNRARTYKGVAEAMAAQWSNL